MLVSYQKTWKSVKPKKFYMDVLRECVGDKWGRWDNAKRDIKGNVSNQWGGIVLVNVNIANRTERRLAGFSIPMYATTWTRVAIKLDLAELRRINDDKARMMEYLETEIAIRTVTE